MTGILNVYKPEGMTSHDVVSFIRRTLKMKRVGHTGTLDPAARGVLPVLIGNATKLSDIIMSDQKGYRAKVVLGIKTDTDDTTGKVIETKEVSVTQEQIEETVKSFLGEIEQIPPMYSAIKINGKKLYQLAREGVEIERKPRKVTIHKIDVYNFNDDTFNMDIHCSKGTYIRSLCRDIGESLKTGAAMAELERTMSGIFTKENSHTLEEIENAANSGNIESLIIKPDEVLSDFKKVCVVPENAVKIKNGIRLRPEQLGIEEFSLGQIFRIYENDELFCLLKIKDCDGKKLLTMEKSFY